MTSFDDGGRLLQTLQHPTSVFLGGRSRSLLNWVGYALASNNPGGFVWTDVELPGEERDPNDLLARSPLPPGHFGAVTIDELRLDHVAGNAALGGLVRSESPGDAVERLADFLRLPEHTRRLISGLPREGPPVLLVLSNAQRVMAYYPAESVAPVVRAIVGAGASLLATWAEAPPPGRWGFDHVWQVEGWEASRWSEAVLTVEKPEETGPVPAGTRFHLRELPFVAAALSHGLGSSSPA